MKALTYISHNNFALTEKPQPVIQDPRDAVVRVTLGSICTSDLHIKHGSVPRAGHGITVGHEMVGVVEAVGSEVKNIRPGDTCVLKKLYPQWGLEIRLPYFAHGKLFWYCSKHGLFFREV